MNKTWTLKAIVILSLGFTSFSGMALSELGEKKSVRADFNQLIDSSHNEMAAIDKNLDKVIEAKGKDRRIQKLINDELGWDNNENAGIHRVPQSVGSGKTSFNYNK